MSLSIDARVAHVSNDGRVGDVWDFDYWVVASDIVASGQFDWLSVVVDFNDGTTYETANGIFLNGGPYGPDGSSDFFRHTFLRSGTFHVAITVINDQRAGSASPGIPADGQSATVVIPVTVGPGFPTPPNYTWDRAHDLGVLSFAPANSLSFEVDTRGAPNLTLWYSFELPYNAKVYFNYYNGESSDNGIGLGYEVYRQDFPGLAGLQDVWGDSNNPSNVEQGSKMVFLSNGLISSISSATQFVNIAGIYFIKVVSTAIYRQTIELHAELTPGAANRPVIYLGDQPGFGGTASPAPALAADVRGTLIAAEWVSEADNLGYIQGLLAHTDDHGLFFYDFADPWQGGVDWDHLTDNEFEFPALATADDGSWMALEYAGQDVGSGAVGRFDATSRFRPDGQDVSVERMRVFKNTLDYRSGSRDHLIPWEAPWLIEGHLLSDAAQRAVPAWHAGRHTWFVAVDYGVEFVDQGTAIVECDIDGHMIQYWVVPDPYNFGVITDSLVAFPDDLTGIYASIFDDVFPGFRNISRFDLETSTFTHVSDSVNWGEIHRVKYDGEWCFATWGKFTDNNLYIVGRDGTVFVTETAPTTTNLAPWGGTVGATVTSRIIGTGGNYDRVWASHFQPKRPTAFTGSNQFGTEMWFYDIPSAQWSHVGTIYADFTDTYGHGGEEIQYWDVYDTRPALLIPGPTGPNAAGAAGTVTTQFWRHRA